jgi:hypothetical protein
MATIREYQILIVTFRYSKSFFQKITTQQTDGLIKRLLEINEQIVADRGFDDSPYTQITLSTFGQLHKLTQDIMNLPVSEDLKKNLKALIPDYGNVMAIAKQGDRPKTFAAATEVYRKIAALYPMFQEVAPNNQAFETVLGIEGLAEFYAEFAQIHD